MKTLFIAILLLFCTPAFACIYSATVTNTYVQVCAAADSCRTIFYTGIPKTSQQNKNEIVRLGLQTFLDTRLPLDEFPPEDPAKGTNPNCENFYWGLQDGTLEPDPLLATHLIARDCVVENVTFDGVEYNFTIRRADRCQ